MDKERRKFYKVLTNSERVKDLRKLFGLSENEYIVDFGEKLLVTNIGNKISKIEGQKDVDIGMIFLHANELVKKMIIDFFDLKIDEWEVVGAIFQGYSINRGFNCKSDINELGKFEIKIEFETMPTSNDLTELDKEIRRKIELAKYQYSTKDYFIHRKMRNLKTSFEKYKKIKTDIKHFDKKFEISQEYKKLLKQYPKGIPASERDQLVSSAKNTLSEKRKRSGYTIDELRKDINQFDEYLDS